jgi:hypothetical protein
MYIKPNKINRLREILAKEAEVEFGFLTVEHWKLVEMRLQTLIMVNLGEEDIQEVNESRNKNHERSIYRHGKI